MQTKKNPGLTLTLLVQTKKNPGLLDGMKLDAYDKPEQNNMIADSTNMYGEPEVSLQHQEEHNDYDNNSGNNGESLNMSQGGRKQQPMWGPGGEARCCCVMDAAAAVCCCMMDAAAAV